MDDENKVSSLTTVKLPTVYSEELMLPILCICM